MLNETGRSATLVARVAFPLLTLLGVGACSAESIREGAEASPLDGPQAPVQEGAGLSESEIGGAATNTVIEEVLAELTVGGQTFSFSRWGTGDDAVLVLQASGASTEGSLADAVERQAGQPLTFLELFRALAPKDEVPPALLEAHAEQALALGRGGEEEVRVVAQVDKIVPPPGVDPCTRSLFFPATWVWFDLQSRSVDDTIPNNVHYLCVGHARKTGGQPTSTSCTEFTELRQRAGVCVPGSHPVTSSAGYGELSGGWGVTNGVLVPEGQYHFWEFAPSATKRRLAIIATEVGEDGDHTMRTGRALPNIQ